MNKILMVDTTFPINTRTERFRESLQKKYNVFVCAWSRDKVVEHVDLFNYFIYSSHIGYGNQLKKLIHLPFFFFFLLRVSIRVRPSVIFASHWDSLICSTLIKLLFGGRIKIVYDCLDMPTIGNGFLHKLLVWIEHLCLRFTDLTIFASRHFKDLYPEYLKCIIFENYPSKSVWASQVVVPSWFDSRNFELYKCERNISWIGVVRYLDILENILEAILNTDYMFCVFGDGPDLNALKEIVKNKNLDNQVVFFGRYSSSDLKFIYSISDLVWAAYPTKDFNAIYAISNKYFECSYFNKVPIISKGTKMADALHESPNVILLDEYSVEDIKSKILSFKVSGNFQKYEPDVTWEEREDELLSYMQDNLCI
ncbi:MAG: glycosyltransferase [Chitinophagaceae bacterium]|nr:glycosyltransferase [Chitinophagaceae bacterium]